MTTVQAKKNPGSRREIGDAVLEAAKTVSTTPVKKRLVAFATVHRDFKRADDAASAAEEKLRAQQGKVAEADVEQDEAIAALAAARIGDGENRTRPFADLGYDAPSRIQEMGYAAETKAAKALAAKAAKTKGASAGTKRAAAGLVKAANAVETSFRPIKALDHDWRAALHQREALSQRWETALAALKRSARAAEDDGASGLFSALFERPGNGKARKKQKGPPPPGGT